MDKEKENEQIWICGKYISHSMRHNKPEMEMSWEFAGCFSTEEKAIKACPNDQYFIAPANIDEIVPVDPAIFPQESHDHYYRNLLPDSCGFSATYHSPDHQMGH